MHALLVNFKLITNVPCTLSESDNNCENNLTTSASEMPVHVSVRSYRQLFPSDIDHVNNSQRVQLRLVQSDHRGGFCDCWAVSDLSVSFGHSSSLDIPVKYVLQISVLH